MMKGKKSFLKFAVFLLIAAMCVSSLIACSQAEEKGDLFPEYNPKVYNENEYKDDAVTLDGAFDEDVWKDAEWHEMQSVRENRNEWNNVTVLEDATIRATVAVAEKGMYVGVTSTDKVIYVGDEYNSGPNPDIKARAFGKTGVTMYFADARNRYRSGRFSYEMGFAADGMVSVGYSGDSYAYSTNNRGKIYSATQVQGKLNSNDANGYSIEVFVPWTSLAGVDADDAPASIVATFASHRYDKAAKDGALVWEMLDARNGQDWMETAAWVEYGSRGVKSQDEGNVFGTYGTLGYDAAFDLSGDVDGDERKVTFAFDPTARRQSRLYVRDLKDTSLYAEARFTIGDYNGWTDQWPMLGFSFHGDRTTVDDVTASCAVHAGVTLDLKNANKFNSTFAAAPLNGADFTGARAFNTNKPFDPTSKDGFKMSVYRKGETFYIFYNDKLYDIKSYNHIKADTETFIGLFVLNLPVTVTEYAFRTGEEAEKIGEDAVKNYLPADYVIDGVAESKWDEYTGAVVSLKNTDASGKTFTAKAVMGSNGLYFIAEARHEFYFDRSGVNWSEWANQYNTPGVAGVTNISVAIGNNGSPKLHFSISKYGVNAAGGGSGANVIAVMKTIDTGAENGKTRYKTVAECFVPAPELEEYGGYTDSAKNCANLQLVFVSHDGEQKDNLETAGNYYTASSTDWKWTWPLAVPANNELNSFARNVYMKVTSAGIEKQPAVNVTVNGSATDESATVTINHSGDYKWGAEYSFTVGAADTHKVTEVKVNGTTVTAQEGSYKFTYNGTTVINVITARKGLVSVIAPENVTVTVDGNADLSKVYNDGENVSFAVACSDEYYTVTAVKVNGAPVTEQSGKYTKAYSSSEGVFAISVETALAYADAEIKVNPRNTGDKGKTGGITLTFTHKTSGDSFTATANANGVIELTKKPTGTYTVRGRLFGGELKFADVTLANKDNTVEITHNGTGFNYGANNTAIVDYGTSSVKFGAGENTCLLGTQAISGEVWFTMKITMPNRTDWNNVRLILAPEDWNNRDFVEFLHNDHGFIKFMAENSSTINSTDIGAAMTDGSCYVAFARTADNKFKMAWANTAEGLKNATVKEYTSKTNGAAIEQIGFTSSAGMGETSFKYISSGTTLDAAIGEMKAYEAKDAQ